ncbi:hypothetical protein H5410_041692 [Solanum commersonii]|uniref:J domain-containing protein n=1 Tax=Solanum commersonii TaxID=4109 RepID=A0A9J5XTT7_SOLCO|nr:hypothetical protein H5410_041692 [Solanum commersonii]
MDFHGILSVDSLADGETIKKHYRRISQTLHCDKNLHIRGNGRGVKLLTPKETMSALNWEAFLKKSNLFIKTNACFVPDSIPTCSKVDKLIKSKKLKERSTTSPTSSKKEKEVVKKKLTSLVCSAPIDFEPEAKSMTLRVLHCRKDTRKIHFHISLLLLMSNINIDNLPELRITIRG